jgi:hypothetical protein
MNKNIFFWALLADFMEVYWVDPPMEYDFSEFFSEIVEMFIPSWLQYFFGIFDKIFELFDVPLFVSAASLENY